MTSRHTYPVKPDDQPPVCPHCNGTRLVKDGHDGDRQRYTCRGCNRRSFGVLPAPAPYLKCPHCQSKLWQKRKPDGRIKYTCSKCGKCQMSYYRAARREPSKVFRYKHKFAVVLDRRSRLCLNEYVQAKGCTVPQAVRAIFRHVLTGKVFLGCRGTTPRSWLLTRIERNPAAAAMRFPNLTTPESARKKLVGSGGHFKNGFQPIIMGVQTITVLLDDEAKEGLVYAMSYLGLNHADAARWLLTHVQMPDAKTPEYLRLHAIPFAAISGGKKRTAPSYDPDWDDD
jgi:transposase-like protein